MTKAQPFSSCINTLLRVISANNALQKASAGTRRGKLLPQLPLALRLRAGGRLPAPACPDAHPTDWGDADKTVTQILGPAGNVASREAEEVPQHLGASLATAKGEAPEGSSMLLPVSLWACWDAAEPRGDLWLQVPGCSSLEVVGQAQEGRQGALPMSPARRGRDQRSSDQQSPFPGTGELWQQGLGSRD